MKTVGKFRAKGSGAIVIGLGYIPGHLALTNLTDADLPSIEWNKAMPGANVGGLARSTVSGGPAFSKLAFGAGVRPYKGGYEVVASGLDFQVPAQMVDGWRGDLKGEVTGWTLQTPASRTGKFDAGLDTTKIGPGSIVTILDDGGVAKDYTIVALTNDGDGDNEVTLDGVPSSGRVVSILCAWDYVPAPVGFVMPDGIQIDEHSKVNVANKDVAIVAD